ncbi:MAG: AmpG family muropeptide MFS transporter [Elusimicrobia bacterium]|nr:AmpG family muropeptide MFS transporter [Elusimicrobiota bacterium]
MLTLALLGFSGGLPLFLTGKVLQAWMTAENVDLTTIGLFSLVATPYSLKFLWAPLVDRFAPPFLGRRRGWMAAMQVALALALGALAAGSPRGAMQLFAFTALAVAFFSATLDVVIDAYRADVLEPSEMGAGAAVYVLGYRVALLATGSAALILADRMSWSSVYWIMSGVMLAGLAATLCAPEPVQAAASGPRSLSEAVLDPFRDFFGRSSWRAAVILVFVVLYRLADSLAANMATPFLLKSGFTQTDVGAIQGGVGLLATIVGALSGGAVLSRLGINRCLWVFGVLQIASNLGYYVLSLRPTYPFLVAAMVVENYCAGLVVSGFVAFFMSLCSPRYSATQYALLTALMAFSRDVLVAPAGRIAAATGWPGFFLVTIAAGLPGMLLLPFFAPWNAELPFGARQKIEGIVAEPA